ncbi:uncharacterized protein [Typha angustifolia]|uniref:uncharacterized protein isoform X1 n=1 Tax=Typha angustifolia TaxID=59011 RepID=UPI003C2C2E8D
MSRCFPFPPPGYEKVPRSVHADLLQKEKHKEKKHKKEKKEKEKREGKEKRDKDRSKDKHKEKKDRKEKHKDKKKGKDKDKSRTSEERTGKQTEVNHEERIGESSQKAEEAKNSKFKVELGRRIRDEEKGAASRLVETGSLHRSIENVGAATAVEKERATVSKMVPISSGIAQRKNVGMEQQTNNAVISIQRKSEGLDPETSMQKERGSSYQLAPCLTNTGQRGNGVDQTVENPISSVQRSDSTFAAAVAGNRSGTINKIIPNTSIKVQRTNDGKGQPAESFSNSIHRKIEGMGLANVVEKEKGLLQCTISERGRDVGTDQYLDKNAEKRDEGKEKCKEREADDRKKVKDKGKDRDEKKKRKDKEKRKEKEKEKTKEKGDKKHKEHDKPRESSKNHQIDNPKSLALDKDNGKNAGTDENSKKRKYFETNGFLHEDDKQPAKFPRTAPSNLPVENGRILPSSHVAAPISSSKPGSLSNIKAEKQLNYREQNINGTADSQKPPTDTKVPVSVVAVENGEGFHRPPHPDSKYLSQIYSVPKIEEWPESDDQNWLFASNHLQPKPKIKLEVDETPLVWAEAVQIEADAIALPYVIPF